MPSRAVPTPPPHDLDRLMRTPPISHAEKTAAREAIDRLNREQRDKNRRRVFAISTF